MNDNVTQGDRLTPEETVARLRSAKLVEYDHGGGRLYFESPGGVRDLIADFYGEGHYRDFIMDLVRRSVQPANPCTCPQNGVAFACPTHGPKQVSP